MPKKMASLNSIGVVRLGKDQESHVEVFPEYCEGLRGIDVFSHLIILYWAHQRDTLRDRKTLLVFPRRHSVNVETGVFACRSPSRPNPIGLCVVELVNVDGCILTVKGLDALPETPIIDVKPYLPGADAIPHAKTPQWTRQGPAT